MQVQVAGSPGGDRTAVGVDIGGTRIKAGLVDADGAVLRQLRVDTPHRGRGSAAVEDAVVQVVSDLLRQPAEHADPLLVGIGVAAAGLVDASTGTVVFAPHFAWRDEPLARRLGERLGRQVLVDNDANAAAWGERLSGAGLGEEDFVLVALGTGIGGARIDQGRIVRGRHGLAGEYGHMRVVPDGRPCECGHRGCWEKYASGAALPEETTRRAGTGDPVAVAQVAEVGRWLGIGLADLTAALDPGGFVIGGGVSEAGELLLGPAREALAEQLLGRGHRPLPWVRPAQLGAGAGFIGAAGLVLHPPAS